MSVVGCGEETKFIYYIDEEETPYLVKLNIAPSAVTLGDFKNALNRPHSKFFFKSLDDDFGVVKEEIFDDNASLPCFNGRVVSWLVTTEGSTISDTTTCDVNEDGTHRPKTATLSVDAGNHCSHDFQQQHNHTTTAAAADSTSAASGAVVTSGDVDTESMHSANQDGIAPLRNFHNYKSGRHHYSGSGAHCGHHNGHYTNGPANGAASGARHRHHHRIYGATGSGTYDTPSSMMSSDLESTSFFDSEDESSRFSSVTGTTMSSRQQGRVRQRRRRRRPPPISRASSFSSITDSTLSLNILAVTLNMDTVNFLGISIVGQSNKAGDGGIYVGSIMKGGAVAQDGRIEPGDMILEVNGISFEEMSNDDAVRTLREQVQRPGPITLVVAKCWDQNPRGGYFTIPRQEPVCPIDPRAWVLHTNAMTTPDGTRLDPKSSSLLNGLVGGGAVAGGGGGGPSSGGDSSSTLSPLGATGLTPGMSMGTLTSGQTSMPLGTSAAAYNMAALLAASQHQQQHQQQPGQPPPPHHLSHQHHLLHQPHSQQQHPTQPVQLSHPTFCPVPNMMLPPGYTQQITPSVVTASSSLPEIERYSEPVPLTVNTHIPTVIGAMIQLDSGLDIRDRVWLKLTVPNAFIGSDLVDWLYGHLDGFSDRRSARKYATNLLKSGYIRHTVNKNTFSEQCYYVFRNISRRMSCLSLEEVDSVSEVGNALPMPPNWGHNTTSTNLTVNAAAAAAALHHNGNHQQHHQNGLVINPMDLMPPATSLPAPPLIGVECGGSASGSGQYSSVPTGTVAPYQQHACPPAPIRQLIADGQDATAGGGIGQGMRPTAAAPRDALSGYSDSSSSSDSDLDNFVPKPPRTMHPGLVDMMNPPNLMDLTFSPSALESNTARQPSTTPFPSSMRPSNAFTMPCSPATAATNGSKNNHNNSTDCPTALSATCSSVSEAGPNRDNIAQLNSDTTANRNARRSSLDQYQHQVSSEVVGSKTISAGSLTGSSSSSGTSTGSSNAGGSGRNYTDPRAPHMTQQQQSNQQPSHRLGANHQQQQLPNQPPPPPPPPRISTALSGFTLTSRP